MILVLCPSEIKMTKTALETGRTFSTLFADITLRHDLLEADTVPAFKEIIRKSSEDFAGLSKSTKFFRHFVHNCNLSYSLRADLEYIITRGSHKHYFKPAIHLYLFQIDGDEVVCKL